MKQSFASAAWLRGGGPILNAARRPCRYAGCHHLGSLSVARYAVMAGTEFCLVMLIAVGPSARLAQHDPLWDLAKGDHAPQRDEQLASEGDDHLRLACAPDALGAALEPLSQSAVLLKQQEAPGELDQAAAHAGVAGLGEPLLPSLGAALVRRTGEAGVTCD